MCETGTTGVKIFVFGNYIDEVLFRLPFFYYVHDHLYSPVATVLSNGTIYERYEYDAYGSPTIWNADFSSEKSTTSNPYLFTGRRTDYLDSGSLKIQYNRNRYYDYYTGRWLTHDPLDFVDGMNRYEYVRSNSVTGSDPWGFSGEYKYDFVSPPALLPPTCPWKHSDSYTIEGSVPPWGPWEDGGWNVEFPPLLLIPVLELRWAVYHDLAKIFWLPYRDASRLLLRFLKSKGDTEISYRKMLHDSDEAREHFAVALDVAAREAERLVTDPDSNTEIVQDGHLEFRVTEPFNWLNAVHYYHTWGHGMVRKGKGRRSCCYYMNWQLNFRDKYQFTDSAGDLWELNHYGFAKHFKVTGDAAITVNWIKGYEFRDKHKDAVITGVWPIFPQCH